MEWLGGIIGAWLVWVFIIGLAVACWSGMVASVLGWI
jgi:hypothetical protein